MQKIQLAIAMLRFERLQLNERAVRFKFNRFSSENLYLKNEPRGWQGFKVNNVEANLYQATKELASWLNVSLPTAFTNLHQIR